MAKFDNNGVRLCDQERCDLPATHTLVWAGPQCYCAIHARQAINIAGAMGFPTPARTLRPMTLDEMLPPSPAPSVSD